MLKDAGKTLSATINLTSAYFEKVLAKVFVRSVTGSNIFLEQISSRDKIKWFYNRSQSTFTFLLSVHIAVVCIS